MKGELINEYDVFSLLPELRSVYSRYERMTEVEKILCKMYLEDYGKYPNCNEYKLLMELLDKEPCENSSKSVEPKNEDGDMNTSKNICPDCGGKLLIEAIGNYGDIYRMRADGEMSKRRMKRVVYEGTEQYMIYCERCRNTFDTSDYGF